MTDVLADIEKVRSRIAAARSEWLHAADLAAIRESFARLCQSGQPPPQSQSQLIAGVPTESFGMAFNAPAVLYFHGGGYQIGSTQSHRDLIAAVAVAAERPVIGVNYRLAPEHRYPAALEDVLAVYAATAAQDRGLPLVGDSAGAGLALALFQKIRSKGLPLPPQIVLISPWLDLELSGPSYVDRVAEDVFSTPEALARMARTYVGRNGSLEDPLISPIRMNTAELPPTLIHAGGADITLSDSENFFQRAKADGRTVDLKIWDGMFHHFQMFTHLPQSKESLAEIGAFLSTASHSA